MMAYELRVKYVDGRVFVGAIDTTGSANGKTDWRVAETGAATWQPGTLPADVTAALRRLMDALRLRSGVLSATIFTRTIVQVRSFPRLPQ
ncbi:MAG: hypothetical protein GY856_47895 [bacterium]|nr:hypothetical protein [bacterium]